MRGFRWAAVWVLVLGASLAHGTEPGGRAYDAARASYRALSDDGPDARRPDPWRRVAEAFRRVAADAPTSGKADDGLYMAGLCWERAYALSDDGRDRAAAESAYLRLAEDYRRSNLADDGLLRAGRLLEARGDLSSARAYYRRIEQELPQGDMTTLARKRLAELGRRAAVTGVRSWSGSNYTRVVVDLSRSAPFAVRNLPPNPEAGRPDRIYLDFARAVLRDGCPGCVPIADGLVRQVRAGQHDSETARVVLDLEGPVSFRVFPLDAPSRVVLDVFRAKARPDVVASIIRDGEGSEAVARPLRIAIDPGHGGRDPGALGPNGLQEKDITLALGLELARELRERMECEILLTRTGDVYLGLEERTALANGFGADLFVSLHVNANRSRSAKGIETYYLDRASDRAARRLAARENASTEEGLAEVEHILRDVLLTPKIRESRALAQAVQSALVSRIDQVYGSVRDLGVKRGPFYVLTGAVMPAVLVETSFITHPVEARRLAEGGYRKDLARAVALGVENFVGGG